MIDMKDVVSTARNGVAFAVYIICTYIPETLFNLKLELAFLIYEELNQFKVDRIFVKISHE